MTLGERSSVQAVKTSRRRPLCPPTSPLAADPSTEGPDAEEGTKASGSEHVPSEGDLDDIIIDTAEEAGGRGWEAEIEAAAGPTAAAGKRSRGKKAARRMAAAEKLRVAHRRSKEGTKRAVPTKTQPSRNRGSVMEPNTEPSAWSLCTEDESSGSGGTHNADRTFLYLSTLLLQMHAMQSDGMISLTAHPRCRNWKAPALKKRMV